MIKKIKKKKKTTNPFPNISFIALCVCEKGLYISVYTSLKLEKKIVSYFTIFKTFILCMPFVHR